MLRGELLHSELSRQIIGVFYDVYNELGAGFLEAAYQKAMAIALADAGIRCEREVPVPISFRGRHIGDYRLDLLVDRRIVVECKTSDSLAANHQAQVINYLKATGLPLGIVLLFGSRPVFKRVIYQAAQRKNINP